MIPVAMVCVVAVAAVAGRLSWSTVRAELENERLELVIKLRDVRIMELERDHRIVILGQDAAAAHEYLMRQVEQAGPPNLVA